MTILAVCGMAREARVLAAPGVCTVIGRAVEYADFANVQGIISIGVAGGLAPARNAGDCVVATAVITREETFATHSGWTRAILTHLPSAIVGALVGADVPLGSIAAKAQRYCETGAQAADTESHRAARAAYARGLPFAAVRVVLDPAERAVPPCALAALASDGTVNGLALMASLIERPSQFPELIATARDSRVAMRSLLRCCRLLGFGLAAPDFGELALDMR